jgi:hypothetical protein
MDAMISTAEVPLTEAALRLKKSYLATRDMAFRGKLDARRDARGRWLVTAESVERALRSPAT